MKIQKLLFPVFATLFVLAGFVSCSEDEAVVERNPLVAIKSLGQTTSSISFSIKASDADAAAYKYYKSEDEIQQPAELFASGEQVGVDSAAYEVKNLEPNTTYYVAAVAKAGEKYSPVVKIRMITVQADNLYSFDVEVGTPTHNSVPVKVTPSSEDARYVVDIVPAADVASMSDEDLYRSYFDRYVAEADSTGATLESVLEGKLRSGVIDETFESLVPETEYVVVVVGMDPVAGFRTSPVSRTDFATTYEVKPLTFAITVTDVEAVTAHISVVPSDEVAPFVWLCQPVSTYEGMSAQEIAESYVNTFKDYLDSGMGLYSGTQDYPGFSLMASTDYFVIAFGYNQGITSEVYEERFTTLEGADPETLECDITFPDIQAERVTFNVVPNENSIHYYCGAFVKSEYTDQKAKDMVAAAINDFYQMQVEWNPNYPIEQVVESVCALGTSTGDLSPLYGDTEYTFFVVPVTNKGEVANKVITTDFRTATAQYSDAVVTSEYLGSFDALELQAAGYFTEASLNENTIVMVYKLNFNEYCNLVKYKLWYGATDATDSDLIGWIEPYWDGQRTKDQFATDFLVFITNLYSNDVTFLSIAYDSNNVASKMDRNYVERVERDQTSSVEEFKTLLDMLPSESHRLNVSRK